MQSPPITAIIVKRLGVEHGPRNGNDRRNGWGIGWHSRPKPSWTLANLMDAGFIQVSGIQFLQGSNWMHPRGKRVLESQRGRPGHVRIMQSRGCFLRGAREIT